jgi:hypothetical protein
MADEAGSTRPPPSKTLSENGKGVSPGISGGINSLPGQTLQRRAILQESGQGKGPDIGSNKSPRLL